MIVLLAIINAAIVVFLTVAIGHFIQLRSVVDLSEERARDAFTSSLAVLFSNQHGDPDLRKRQRLTVRLFCAVILLVVVSRTLLIQWFTAEQ